jgi:hypothetical protein
MTLADQSGRRPLMTVVLRVWLVDSFSHPDAFHVEARHVQTGEVTYFRTIGSVAQHIERLAHTLVKPPIELIEFRHRSDHV